MRWEWTAKTRVTTWTRITSEESRQCQTRATEWYGFGKIIYWNYCYHLWFNENPTYTCVDDCNSVLQEAALDFLLWYSQHGDRWCLHVCLGWVWCFARTPRNWFLPALFVLNITYVKTKKVIMYSDQCGGQNRNIKLSLIFQYIASHPDFTFEEIDHKFLVSGHSYLPCDQDFGVIEKNKKFFKEIYISENWLEVIKTARKGKRSRL